MKGEWIFLIPVAMLVLYGIFVSWSEMIGGAIVVLLLCLGGHLLLSWLTRRH